MSKEKLAEEKVKAARENGVDSGMSGIDDRHVLRLILPYTDDVYETQMEVWREVLPHEAISNLELENYTNAWLASSL